MNSMKTIAAVHQHPTTSMDLEVLTRYWCYGMVYCIVHERSAFRKAKPGVHLVLIVRDDV
jgi:hypothetical protein